MSATHNGTRVRAESLGDETIEIDGETLLVRGYEYVYDWNVPTDEIPLDELNDAETALEKLESNPAVTEIELLVRASDIGD